MHSEICRRQALGSMCPDIVHVLEDWVAPAIESVFLGPIGKGVIVELGRVRRCVDAEPSPVSQRDGVNALLQKPYAVSSKQSGCLLRRQLRIVARGRGGGPPGGGE